MKHLILYAFLFSIISQLVFPHNCTQSIKFNSIYCININSVKDIEYELDNHYFYLVIENSTIDIISIKEIAYMFYHITFWNSNVSCSEISSIKMASNTCFNSASSVMGPQLPDYNLNVHSVESYVIVYVTLLFAGLLNAITWIISLHLKKKKLQYEMMVNGTR